MVRGVLGEAGRHALEVVQREREFAIAAVIIRRLDAEEGNARDQLFIKRDAAMVAIILLILRIFCMTDPVFLSLGPCPSKTIYIRQHYAVYRRSSYQSKYYASCGFWGWGRCARYRFTLYK